MAWLGALQTFIEDIPYYVNYQNEFNLKTINSPILDDRVHNNRKQSYYSTDSNLLYGQSIAFETYSSNHHMCIN